MMSIFEPAVRFVGRLSFRNKLRATALVFGIPLLISLVVILIGIGTRVSTVQYEREALAIQAPALKLLATLHQYVAASQGAQEGDPDLPTVVEARRLEVDAALQRLDLLVGEHKALAGYLSANAAWNDKVKDLVERVKSGESGDLSEIHAQLRALLREELDRLNGDSGLLVDDETASSRLIDVVTSQLPELIDNTGQAARLGTSVLVSKRLKSSRRNELTLVRGNFDAFVFWSMDKLQKVVRERPAIGGRLELASGQLNTAFLAVQEAMTTKMLDTADFDMAPQSYLEITAGALSQALGVVELLQKEADALLAARQSVLEMQRNIVVITILAILGLVIAGFISAYISIMRGLNGLSDAVRTMAAGDLSARAPISTQDEIGDVGEQFNRMVESLAERTALLHEKTNDIQNMLHHMPQGILTIVAGGSIHSEYSVYLETIFETKAVAGRLASGFIFDGSDVGPDALSQIEATISACIGEDRMNFDFNAHLLVGALKKSLPDGRVKYLEMSWSPICDSDDVVQKIMVCVRDVSELRVLEAEAEQQKRELEMIGQILAVNQERFHEFVESSRQFVAENESLLRAADDKHPEMITRLFRNMHTIKGNARTYGLLHLSNVVHEAEQAYDELRKNTDLTFEKERLLDQLQSVMQLIEDYASLNEVKLGRRGPGRRASAEKYVMVPRVHIERMIDEIGHVDSSASAPVLWEAVQRVRHDLDLIGTESIQDVLGSVFDSLPALATELGKEPPILRVIDDGIQVRNPATDLLRNTFMHLYRNSMDHGIERPEVRLAKGKPAAGTIQLTVTVVNQSLILLLTDDGQGLALDHIRQKGIEKGLLDSQRVLEDEAVARLIFAPGFSTAASVTEVSGRGVGMDAVQEFIKREGGSIQLILTDDNDGAPYRQFMTSITLPARFAVVPLPVCAAAATAINSAPPAADRHALAERPIDA